jgi:hypothetical protein
LPGLVAGPLDECYNEDEERLDEGCQDQPASFPRPDLVRELAEDETSNHKAFAVRVSMKMQVKEVGCTYQLIDTAMVCSTFSASFSLLKT